MVKSKYCPQRKTCPSVTLSTTNPTWTGLGFNPGPRSNQLVTNSLRVCWHVSFSNLSHALQALFTSCKSYTRLRISWLAKEDHETLRLSSTQSAKHYKYLDQTSSHLVLCIKKDISLHTAHKQDFTPFNKNRYCIFKTCCTITRLLFYFP